MQKILLASAVIVAVLGGTASAGFVATLNNAGGSGNAVTINPDASQAARTFSVDINTSVSPESIVSTEMNIYASDAGVATITGGSYGPDWSTSPTYYEPIPVGAVPTLAEVTNDELLGLLGNLPVDAPLTGNSLYATLTIEVPAGTPEGEYTLNVTGLVVGDDNHDDIGGSAGADFTVTVLPEPTTVFFLLSGFAALVLRRNR